MSSRTVASLHITNGDSVVYTFKKAGILGTHLPWRDMLHEGPVPGGVSLEDCSRVRGSYLASRGYGKPIRILHDFQARDAVIRRSREFDEVVLWFEHDLYDQLQLLQVLTVLREMDLEPGNVSCVQSDSYLGSMTAEEIVALHPKRRTVTRAMFDRAFAVWNDFCSGDPRLLLAQTASEHAGFPHMRTGLRRLCEEYPWSGDGLSRSQRHALQAVAQGAARNDELFRRAQAREEAPFLGDTAFYAILRDLREGAAALIEGEEGMYEPTALGRRILGGDADWLEQAAADRWIGGVHIEGRSAVRWDDVRQMFIFAEQAVDS
jgi:hypothetical protein